MEFMANVTQLHGIIISVPLVQLFHAPCKAVIPLGRIWEVGAKGGKSVKIRSNEV